MKFYKLFLIFLTVITFGSILVSCSPKEDFKADFNEQAELLGLSGISEDADVKPGSEYSTEISESVELKVILDKKGVATNIIISSDKDDSEWDSYANCVIEQYKGESMNPELADMLIIEDVEESDGYASSVKLSDTALAKITVNNGVRTLEIIRTAD